MRTGQPAPTGLADYWEIAPDDRTYTFHLNKDAKWHDGVDVTAEDVQFSFDALANPDTGSVYTGSFVDTVESWRAIDDDTFEMVAKEPLYTVPLRHLRRSTSFPSTSGRTCRSPTGATIPARPAPILRGSSAPVRSSSRSGGRARA